MTNPFTRPTSVSEKDIHHIGRSMDIKSKFSQENRDPLVSATFTWLSSLMLIVVTALLGWVAESLTSLPTMKNDIAALLARPAGVSLEQYNRDEERRNRELNDFRQEWREWRENHKK
jgi:hypothetical protein